MKFIFDLLGQLVYVKVTQRLVKTLHLGVLCLF